MLGGAGSACTITLQKVAGISSRLNKCSDKPLHYGINVLLLLSGLSSRTHLLGHRDPSKPNVLVSGRFIVESCKLRAEVSMSPPFISERRTH